MLFRSLFPQVIFMSHPRSLGLVDQLGDGKCRWIRGTGFMSSSNIVAQQVESHSVRTFSAKEMAFNILGLKHPLLFSVTRVKPIWADLNGSMDRLPDLAEPQRVSWRSMPRVLFTRLSLVTMRWIIRSQMVPTQKLSLRVSL